MGRSEQLGAGCLLVQWIAVAAVRAGPGREHIEQLWFGHHSGVANPRQHGGVVGRPERLGAGCQLVQRGGVASVRAGPGRERLALGPSHGGVAKARQHGGVVGRSERLGAGCLLVQRVGVASVRAGPRRERRDRRGHHSGVANPRQHGGVVGRSEQLGAGCLLVQWIAVAAVRAGPGREHIEQLWFGHHSGVANPRQHGGVVGRPERLGAGRLLVRDISDATPTAAATRTARADAPTTSGLAAKMG